MKRAYISSSQEIATFEKGKQPRGWKLIPKTLYVRWHDDQSMNSLLFNREARNADANWDSTVDLALTKEYADQLAEHLF